MQKPRL